jgi:hypothetical protein
VLTSADQSRAAALSAKQMSVGSPGEPTERSRPPCDAAPPRLKSPRSSASFAPRLSLSPLAFSGCQRKWTQIADTRKDTSIQLKYLQDIRPPRHQSLSPRRSRILASQLARYLTLVHLEAAPPRPSPCRSRTVAHQQPTSTLHTFNLRDIRPEEPRSPYRNRQSAPVDPIVTRNTPRTL